MNGVNLSPPEFTGQPLHHGDYLHFYNAQIPDVTIDMRATGIDGDIFTATDYIVPFGTVIEDGFAIDTQTAMGALVHYCQAHGLDVSLVPIYSGLFVLQIGDNAIDEHTWMHYVNEWPPLNLADQYNLTDDDNIHWANYMLGLYSMSLSLDLTQIDPGDSITVTITYTNGDGTEVPVENAEVYISDSIDVNGNPVPPGTSVGQTNVSGEFTFTWNNEGTFYPYAEWNGRDTIRQRPVVSFTCTGSATPAWDVNGDGEIDVFDMVLVGNHFGETGTPGWIPEDVNSDGTIDVFDMVIIGNHFGE
jgi:hypothetical protein